MHDNKLRLMIIGASILFIIVALWFGGLLNIAAFKQNYAESLSYSYQVAALPTKRNIEYAVRYGKPLAQFTGIEELLKEIKENISDANDVRIVLPDGRILYDVNGVVKNKQLSSELMGKNSFDTQQEQVSFDIALYENQYHVFIPIRDKENSWIGSIEIVIPAAVIDLNVDKYNWTVFQSTVVIGILTLNVLVFMLFAIPIMNRSGQLRKNWLMAIIGTIFIIAQVAYSTFNINLFQNAYIAMAEKNMATLLRSVGEDINSVVSKGVPYNRLVGLDAYLDKIIAGSPEIAELSIVDRQEQVLYKAPLQGQNEQLKRSEHKYSLELMSDKAGVEGKIQIWLSSKYIDQKLEKILLVAISVAVGFFLLMTILVGLLTGHKEWIKYKLEAAARVPRHPREVK